MQPARAHVAQQFDGIADEDLVPLARNKDEAAVRALVRRHNQQLFRVARGVVRDDAEAEDIVQETYVRAFTKLESFEGKSSFSTWLTRIALNEALGRIRRRRPTVELSELDSSTEPDGGRLIMVSSSLFPASPESEASRAQVRRMLEWAVDALPEAFRLVFILRDVQGLSTDDTARRLDIRPETVKTRLHRARRLMRATLEESLAPRLSELFPFDGARCAHVADKVVQRLRAGGW
ncbi:RNA polymerase sigma factor [Limibacillus sp. MBR-115]|jgi:RNA polymerase sigma-70 factor (ECF subfamily)|uniref:RNA polymerase sigma factor n=1 Tax=Limibacillus sp. MBR-115 TaxID=3156465 RepID=UPI003390BCB9